MERFIRPMAPGWFASVMGTAVTSLALTLASHAAADAGPALAAPVALAASALHWLAIAMGSSSKPPSLNDGGADLFKRVTFDQVLKSVESSRER